MQQARIGEGLDRIERALRRAEASARELGALNRRHQNLKHSVTDALHELDNLIDGKTSRKTGG